MLSVIVQLEILTLRNIYDCTMINKPVSGFIAISSTDDSFNQITDELFWNMQRLCCGFKTHSQVPLTIFMQTLPKIQSVECAHIRRY